MNEIVDLKFGNVIKLLAGKIASGQCVLFIGPGIFKDDPASAHSIYETFAMELAKEMTTQGFSFDKTQAKNIFYIVPRYRASQNTDGLQNVNMADMRKKFVQYSQPKVAGNPLFKTLAILPFNIIVNTNPDDKIKTLIQKGRKVHFSYYDRSNNSGADKDKDSATKASLILANNHFSEDSTVIYNLFGSYENNNSLLLTEDELLDYNERVNQNETKISEVLRDKFDNNKYYLFLGFQFDQWLLKIVLKALGLPKGDGITFSVPSQSPREFEQHFYEEQFKFVFVKENNLKGFLDTLTREYVRQIISSSQPIPPPRQKKLKFVILYDPRNDKDAASYTLFSAHLKTLESTFQFWVWTEKNLNADDDIGLGILDSYMDADIIIPLITAEMFVKYERSINDIENICQQRMLHPPLIMPILLRDYDHTSIVPLQNFPWFPRTDEGSLLSVEKWPSMDEVFKMITNSLKELIKNMD